VFRSILLLTKGIIRDQRMRRSMMFWIMLVALVMLFIGAWLLTDRWGREHPWLYLFYWLICSWLTLTGVLLAFLDILALRAAQRAARRVLEKQMLDKIKDDQKE
jgi:protein-S-isoprenylcysteine O-methyltransferase Ste14